MIQLSWSQALAWRMRRHRLVERAPPSELIQVTADLCGLHAQVMSSAELSLWARIDGLERDAVQHALWTDRSLVKLWAARGTLYLLPSTEVGVWLSALRSHGRGGRYSAGLRQLADAISQVLGGRELTRDELAIEVERTTGSAELGEWVRFSWGSYLKYACTQGFLCFGPSRGTQITFTSPATWVREPIVMLDHHDALREITRRFVGGYAPVDVENLSRWWLGPVMPKRAGQLLAALGSDAVQVTVEDQPAVVLRMDLDAMLSAQPSNVARLLPAFDPWVIGAARRPPFFMDGTVGRIYRPQGWVSPVMLVNGTIVGVWKHMRQARRLGVSFEPFGNLPAWARDQLESEAERLAKFLHCELSTQWTKGR